MQEKKIESMDLPSCFTEIEYRPFDTRMVALSDKIADWPRTQFGRNFRDIDNIGISSNRGFEEDRDFSDVFVFDKIVQHHSLSLKEANNIAPLYVAEEMDSSIRVNFDPVMYKKIRSLVKDTKNGAPDEVAVFDYIYGVMHSFEYRSVYKEFLKIDFPRIPWPRSPGEFRDVSGKGRALRQMHLMEPSAIGDTPYPLLGDGESIITRPEFRDGSVWINKTQRFGNVPDASWAFYIGGYQPAQKWLKDRKGRTMSFDDILHYQRIIKVLSETDRIMKTIRMSFNTLPKAA